MIKSECTFDLFFNVTFKSNLSSVVALFQSHNLNISNLSLRC